ncbi:hypothetical protein ACHAWC_011873 [Mediolabrus comicus]
MSSSTEYEIDQVIDYRYTLNTTTGSQIIEYLIKWKNYPSSHNTSWEPETNLNPAALTYAQSYYNNRQKLYHRLHHRQLTSSSYSYDTLVSSVDLTEVTSTHQNCRILQRLMDNDNELFELFIVEEDDDESQRYDGLNLRNHYVPSGGRQLGLGGGNQRRGQRQRQRQRQDLSPLGDDMGWLGYFIGKSTTLENLHIGSLHKGEEYIEPFWTGLQCNRSIQSLRFDGCDVLLSGRIMNRMMEFFKYNGNLTKIELSECILGDDGANELAAALRECTHKQSLRTVRLDDNELRLRGLKQIVKVLMLHPNLEGLTISENNVGREGCRVLGRYLVAMKEKLKDLNVSYNRIDDVGLSLLLEGLTVRWLSSSTSSSPWGVLGNGEHTYVGTKKKYALKQLCLTGNSSITSSGLRILTSLMSTPNCQLEQLWLYHMNIGDEGAAVLTDGLVKNKTLRKLWFNPTTCGITSTGWEGFNTMLCDTSSINTTFLSNHTLQLIGKHYSNYSSADDQIPREIRRHLRMHNKLANSSPSKIAKLKILQQHKNMRMDPFLEKNLMFLPLIVAWFQGSEGTKYGSMKLSCIYQFVRGLPFFFDNESGLAVWAREENARRLSIGSKRKSPTQNFVSPSSSSGQSSCDNARKKRREGRVFAIGDSVRVKLADFFTDVAVVENVTYQGWKPMYQVQFGNGEVWGEIGAEALSEYAEV